MRFLCFHGAGTNSLVLETQIAAIRSELDQHHTFDFVEGTVEVAIDPEIKSYYPSNDHYYNYFSYKSPETLRAALSNLSTFLELEGPYDAAIAYSHGAAFVATYLFQHLVLHPTVPFPFKCVIFISGGIPLDPRALDGCGENRFLKGVDDCLPRLSLPTAHIWGTNDLTWPGTSEVLYDLCEDKERWRYLHTEGHDVPSARAKHAIIETVRVIQRVVDRALVTQ